MKRHIEAKYQPAMRLRITYCGLQVRSYDYKPFDAEVYYPERRKNLVNLCKNCKRNYKPD
jgi:hypothetical protein